MFIKKNYNINFVKKINGAIKRTFCQIWSYRFVEFNNSCLGFGGQTLGNDLAKVKKNFEIFLCFFSSCKELNDWSTLQKYSNSDTIGDANLLMESAWHLNDWDLLNSCLIQVDACANPKTFVKSSLFKVMNKVLLLKTYFKKFLNILACQL